ncbi:MAG: glycosyltransferase [Deltaproteobacteria bacterium]|nr:glycosyltransferase [Deltaproteobacteria bacterium]
MPQTGSRNLIFIVAYNHESFIEKVIARIPRSVISDPGNEVLVIDDGSKDNTFYVTDAIREKLRGRAKITVLKNPVNQGYGGNQKVGYRYALDHGFDRVILVHGDGQYAPELLDKIIAEYSSPAAPDAVFGTRMSSVKSAFKGGMPVYKIIGNRILTWLQNRILKCRMSEFHSGYRSYSVELLRRIPFEVNSNDFHFDTEIIIQCLASKAKIVEIPIPTHYGEEVCHVNGFKYALNVLAASFHFRVQQLGFLYDRKYDVGTDHYPRKASRYSSHSRLVEKIKPGSTVLDVGCGKGHLASDLIAKGCVVDGIDVIAESEIAVKLRRYHRIDLIRDMGSLEAVLSQNAYDYILMADILEHLVEPDRLLDMIRRHRPARSQPVVIASTGNVAFMVVRLMLFFGQFNYGIRGILDRTHVKLFTRKSFRHLFEQSTYVISEDQGIPMPFSAVFSENSRWGLRFEALNAFLLRLFPRFFSYQFLLVAAPLPTTNQILEMCEDHTAELRRDENRPRDVDLKIIRT